MDDDVIIIIFIIIIIVVIEGLGCIMNLTFWGSISCSDKRLFFSPKNPHWVWGPTGLLFCRYLVSFSHEINHLPPSSTEVKNE